MNFDCEHAQLNNRTLIISESQLLIDRMKTLFSSKGWLTESMSTHLIIGQESSSAKDYCCVIFVIDDNFHKLFGGLINEMSAFIRNASAHTSVYLLFEHDNDAAFSTWLTHIKKTFKSVTDQSGMHNAIQNIICSESCMPQEPIFSVVHTHP
jgi:hypothetical protein